MVALQKDLIATAAAHQFVSEILETRTGGIGTEEKCGRDEDSGELQHPKHRRGPSSCARSQYFISG